MATHSSILAWEILLLHRQRSLVGYSPWGHKELDITWRLNFYCFKVTVFAIKCYYPSKRHVRGAPSQYLSLLSEK